jgi:AcrR family transcriptional regulator
MQRRRTRLAIVAAASALMTGGRRPTIADAADAALVSRATAYRYFRTQRALLLEAALHSTHPDIKPALDAVPSDDAVARFEVVCRALFERVVATEALMRQMLQVIQEDWLADQPPADLLRQGRRLEWIEEALHPLRGRLAPDAFAQLVNGISIVVGIEPYVVLRDICRLDKDAVLETMLWTGRTLIAGSSASVRP